MSRSTGISLEKNSDTPLYKQLFDQVVERIQSNAFPPGYRLPPTRDLAQELATHRNTVVRAYADLHQAGFIRSAVGRGTYVLSRPDISPAQRDGAPRNVAETPMAGMPWATLLSRGATVEPLNRLERFAAYTAGRDLINLSRMQPSPDMLPHETLRRCAEHVLRERGGRALGYAPPEGLARLRELIEKDLLSQGVPARAEDILITTGSQQALDLICRALVNPGDLFLLDEMTYSGSLNLLSSLGARMVAVPSDGAGPDLEALQRLSRSGAKGFYLMPNCNNPTGACIGTERRRDLVAWSHGAGVPLIEDDYGADLCLSGTPPPTSLRALSGDVIYSGTFSKKLIPALRIGFILCPKALRPILLQLKYTIDLGTSSLLQHMLAEFLERGYLRAHLNTILPEYRKRRDALVGALRASLPPQMTFHAPDHGVVLWLPLPQQVPPDLVFEEARRRGVLVTPSTLHAVESRHPYGVRLAYCAESAERLAEGGKRVGEAIRAVLRHFKPQTPQQGLSHPGLEAV